MKSALYLVVSVFCIVFAIPAKGQGNLPSLKKDSNIESGTLENGLSYYIVPNKASAGHADIALVQKGGYDEVNSREFLSDLPHFEDSKPYRYLADKGVGYTRKGFISNIGDAAVFTFDNVPTHIPDICDTTLLLIFDIIPDNPCEQAVIICGDVDAATIKGKLSVFAMTVAAREQTEFNEGYRWKHSPKRKVAVYPSGTDNLSCVSISFSSSRISKDRMNTILPLVNNLMNYELGYIIKHRIETYLQNRDIPYSETGFNYSGSADSDSDELFSFFVKVGSKDVLAATEALGNILSNIDSLGAGARELSDIRSEMEQKAKTGYAIKTHSNAEYMRKCIAAYLYGASLASDEAELAFFTSKNMSEAKALEVFNNFASALLDPDANMCLECESPLNGLKPDELSRAFDRGWNNKTDWQYVYNPLPSISSLPKRHGRKVKLSTSIKEPISGGQLWTFSNGAKVIFAKSSAKGRIDYSMLVNGSYAGIQGLEEGMGAFLSDMFPLYNVAGIKSDVFRRMLNVNGIEMNATAGLSGLSISGTAPSDKLSQLLNLLAFVTNERTPDKKAFSYYLKCEKLRLEMDSAGESGIRALSDSLLLVDRTFIPEKLAGNLSENIYDVATTYYRDKFANTADGVLIIIGDLDAEKLQKELCSVLGSISKGQINFSRPHIDNRIRPGVATLSQSSRQTSVEPGIYIRLSAPTILTTKNYMAYRIAVDVAGRIIAGFLPNTGMAMEYTPDFRVFPVEQLDLHIHLSHVPEINLPGGVWNTENEEALPLIREALESFKNYKINSRELAGYKGVLSKQLAFETADPTSVISFLTFRYLEGKDFTSAYGNSINSVTAGDVESILSAWATGSRVEYLVEE